MTLVFGLDVGTQGTKGIAVDAERGVVVGRASHGYGLLEGLPDGAAEQHPATWIEAVRDVLHELTRAVDGASPVALGVSGQQHGCVLLDEAGEPLRAAKLWCDTETAAEAEELSERLSRSVPAGFTAPKVLWHARHEPELYARVAHVLLPHEFVNAALTGTFASEAGDASGTGWFDVGARRLDPEAMQAIDPRLSSLVPPLMDPERPNAPCGRVHAHGAERFGVPEGTLVSAGGGDNMMSAMGSGCVRPGVVTLSLGTSGTVFAHADAPVIDPEGHIAPFCSSHGGWLPLLCVMNLTGVLEEVAQAFDMDHARLTEAARQVEPGCGGMTFLPYLMGERVPDLPRATGVLEGLRPGHLRPGALYRAALEGTSLNLAWGVERLRALGVPIDEVRVVGGAARNELGLSILSDAFGVPVQRLAEAESAALGAALQALWCAHGAGAVAPARAEPPSLESLVAPFVHTTGEPVRPDPERARLYAEQLVHFRERVAHHFPR